MGKVSVFFIKVRVLFWPEISAIGVFLYFDNERKVQRGGGATALRILQKKGSFLRPPHVRDFVKEGYFFVPRYPGTKYGG